MKVVQINAVCGQGSTGKIAVAISELLTKKGVENFILYSSGNSNYPQGIKYQKRFYTKFQALRAKIFGNYGFNSKYSTKKLVKKIEEINPDIIHLHNIHSHNCNLKMLFTYLKKANKKLFWTFHDCWAFTGYCPHFDMIGCDKWQTMCHKCSQKKYYSWFFDKSKKLFNRKKELFNGLDLTIITPSKWLGGLVKQSFLKDYPVKVINNGIDLSIFKPTPSNFREKYNLQDKFVLLGVAFGWDKRKGIDVFIELSKRLSEDYKIILVGTNDSVDKKLPSNIISIHRTKNQLQLAEIYSSADVLVNPTREENFPTVNIEAIACGTPVITFNTGGSKEMLDEKCGIIVEKNNINAMEEAIVKVKGKGFLLEDCVNRAKLFDESKIFNAYVDEYLSKRKE